MLLPENTVYHYVALKSWTESPPALPRSPFLTPRPTEPILGSTQPFTHAALLVSGRTSYRLWEQKQVL